MNDVIECEDDINNKINKTAKNNKIRQELPILFSSHFKIDKARLQESGVFDPILNFDTKVFVEPLLLKTSANDIIKNSYINYQKFFSNLLLLLQKSDEANDSDKCWRTAKELVNFPEYNSTCIGYSSGSTDGRGSGIEFNDKILQSAKDIVEKAQDNSDIFLLLPLLEEGIAGDRISDMVQNIIDEDICKYTVYIMDKLGLEGNVFYETKNFNRYKLLANPYSKSLIKLIPKDILSNLPVADDIDSFIEEMTSHNARLRGIINRDIGDIWNKTTKSYRKEVLLREIKNNKEFFIEALKVLKEYGFQYYDLDQDYEGIYKWLKDSQEFISFELAKETKNCDETIESISSAVRAIIKHFKDIIESKEIWRTFWTKCDSTFKHVKEFYSQMLLFIVCNSWLVSQNSNLKVEIVNKKKQIDLVFTISGRNKLTIYTKHANNGYLYNFYTDLLKRYRNKDDECAYYLIMNFREDKANQLKEVKVIENTICKIFEVDVAQRVEEIKKQENDNDCSIEINDEDVNDRLLSFDDYALKDVEEFRKVRSKGAKKKNEKTDNIKLHVIRHMFISKKQENKSRKVSEISISIINELSNLQETDFHDFAKKYSVNKVVYLQQTIEYLGKNQDGGQIEAWCYAISQGKL